jgi:hypothetical protein
VRAIYFDLNGTLRHSRVSLGDVAGKLDRR